MNDDKGLFPAAASPIQVSAQACVPTVTDPDGSRCRLALSCLDLTSLDASDTDSRIEALCARAATPVGPVAAVCVYPHFVSLASRLLAGSGIRVATVINFPDGGLDAAAASRDTARAVMAGADEIDAVLPWRACLAGRWSEAASVLDAVRSSCKDRTLKIILESGEIEDQAGETAVRLASRLAIAAGADFLKTSTGKTPHGATPGAARAMLSEIRRSGLRTVGFKASGGIRDSLTAALYLDLADEIMGAGWVTPSTFRFGASSLLDNLLDSLIGELGKGGPETCSPADAGAY